MDVSVRLVNQVQVEIVELQATQGVVNRLTCSIVTSVLHPQFGRDEQLFAWDASILDSLPNGRLVHVRSGGINQTIPGVNGIDDATPTLLIIRHLKDAIANDWNSDAIVQYHGLHSHLLKRSDDRDHEFVWFNIIISIGAS